MRYFLSVFLLLSLNSVANEVTPYPIADVELDQAMEYVKDNQVSIEVAKFRLSIQSDVSAFHQQLQQSYVDVYGGLYTQHKPHYQIVVMYKPLDSARFNGKSFRKSIEPLLQNKPWRRFLSFKPVDQSLHELKLLQSRSSDLARKVGVSFDSNINIKTGKVYLGLRDLALFYGQLEKLGLSLPEGITLVELDHLSAPDVAKPIKHRP